MYIVHFKFPRVVKRDKPQHQGRDNKEKSTECFSHRGVPWVVVEAIGVPADLVTHRHNALLVVAVVVHHYDQEVQDKEAPMPRVVAGGVAEGIEKVANLRTRVVVENDLAAAVARILVEGTEAGRIPAVLSLLVELFRQLE